MTAKQVIAQTSSGFAPAGTVQTGLKLSALNAATGNPVVEATVPTPTPGQPTAPANFNLSAGSYRNRACAVTASGEIQGTAVEGSNYTVENDVSIVVPTSVSS